MTMLEANVAKRCMRLLESEGRTELEAARRFAQQQGHLVRYVTTWGKWLCWDGIRWKLDDACQVEALAKSTAEQIWEDTAICLATEDGRKLSKEITQYAKAMSSNRGVNAIIALAKSEDGIPVSHDKLNQRPWLVNVANGTLDLRSSELRVPDKDDLLTQLTPIWYSPDHDYKVWSQFLKSTFAGDLELISFIRRLVGYCLTGQTTEHMLVILFGTGANGKSVFINTIAKLLGEYAGTCLPTMLLAKRGESAHPTELAAFFGKRFVACSETDEGRRLDEAKIKMLTGGDVIQARRMYENFWEFKPTHKLWLATNHKPQVRGTDFGIWRRLRIIPFTQTFRGDNCDPALPDKLDSELSGILNWALFGLQEYLVRGLGENKSVTRATDEYKRDEDQIYQWITDCCYMTAEPHSISAAALYESYTLWCQTNRERALSKKKFGAKLQHDHKLETYTNNGVRYRNINLKVST